MKIYSVTFDRVTYAGGRVAENVVLSSKQENADAAQEETIGFLESIGAAHGNILHIKTKQKLPESGISLVGVK